MHEDRLLTCAVCDRESWDTDPFEWVAKKHVELSLHELGKRSHLLLSPPEPLAPDVEGLPDKILKQMKIPKPLHPDLRAEYDVSGLIAPEDAAMAGKMLLSPRGVTAAGKIVCCTECQTSLSGGTVPEFAIANG
jgi:hypothetical protein